MRFRWSCALWPARRARSKARFYSSAQHGISTGSDPQLTTARTFLRTNCDLLRLDDPHAELTLTRRHTDELGRTHLRFQQEYRGVPVWPADVIVHLNPEGHVDVMNGAFVPTPKKLGTVPVLDAADAAEYARTGLTDGAEAEVSASELIIYAPGDTPPRLAWKLELAIDVTSRWLVVIDAVNGAELTAYSLVMHQQVAGSGVDLFGRTRRLNVWQQDGLFWMVNTSKPMFDLRLNFREHGGIIWVWRCSDTELVRPFYISLFQKSVHPARPLDGCPMRSARPTISLKPTTIIWSGTTGIHLTIRARRFQRLCVSVESLGTMHSGMAPCWGLVMGSHLPVPSMLSATN